MNILRGRVIYGSDFGSGKNARELIKMAQACFKKSNDEINKKNGCRGKQKEGRKKGGCM